MRNPSSHLSMLFLPLLFALHSAATNTVTVTVHVLSTDPPSSSATLSSTPAPTGAVVSAAAVASSTLAPPAADDSSSGIDTNAGAVGSSAGAFSLSKGGLAAIIVVIVVVVVFGALSAVLFFLAKRRQWNIRASIRQSARRLTGKFDSTKNSLSKNRAQARRGIRLDSTATGPMSTMGGRGEVRAGGRGGVRGDIEKNGSQAKISAFEVETPREAKAGWREKVFGFKGTK
ncbi:hypothetical protein B0A49_02497 [Cryomyces minteri]|uniref:Mid2 domain-containing protein n=1 Tax=Cryomyces minteri TaxID=331657 RepID=A0A4U0XTS4_9PEZI|nr:hypothetical protein B0A49_02497 [Cryomyces minteri]